jgi:tetratricopeptide (TPR) repeat protein
MRRLGAAILLLILAPAALAVIRRKLPEPRPISDAERAATAIVTSYLASGPEAVWTKLAAKSPLRRVGHDAALREIEARFGPAKDANWALATVVPALRDRIALFGVTFVSGVDDTVAVEMVLENDAWKVLSLRTEAEPVPRPRLLSARNEPVAARIVAGRFEELLADPDVALALGLPATLLALAGLAVFRTRRLVGSLILTIAGISLIGSCVVVLARVVPLRWPPSLTQNKSAPRAPQNPDDIIRLGALVALRNATAAGDDRAIGYASRLEAGPVRDVATLWEAQLRLQQERYDDVRRSLARFPARSTVMMAELIRARLAFAQSKEFEAVNAYQRAIDIGPGRDTLWIEAGEVLGILGLEEENVAYLNRASRIGSREPLMFYAAAQQAVLDDRESDASKLLMTAWHMRPVERGDIFGMQLLWHVLRLPEVTTELKVGDAAEASFATPSTKPIIVPAGTLAEVSGDDLRIRAGGGELLVHGGAFIAPAGATIIDAGSWRRDAERQALARFTEDAPRTTPGALLQPAFRNHCFLTAAALADRNRWEEIVSLTAALPPRDERVPIELSVLRGEALTKLGRANDLKLLVIDLLANPSLKNKRDGQTMRLVAEMLAAVEEYDGAVKMLARARARVNLPGMEQRVTQLLLEKKLAHSYAQLTTAHLDIHYPNVGIDAAAMEPLAKILEAEYVRLHATWFTKASDRRVTVNILSWDDFREYSGSDYIAGLYTNKVFLPLAGLREYPPDIVAIATHELAHAFIADWSRNLAPRWFHEALASHVEMHEETTNAFRWYEEKRMLSVALLDPLANGSPDPEVISETYSIGEATLRFIEFRYGKAAIGKMLDAFAGGADTDAAVLAVTGASVQALDANARKWGSTQPVLFTGGQVVRYDESAPPVVLRPKRGNP